MKPKIFVTRKVPPHVQSYLAEYTDYKIWDQPNPISRKELLREVAGIQGLLAHGITVDAGLLEAAPDLKVVSNMSVGYNNFDIEEMKKRNILGTNTPGVLDETVADLVLALILSTARRIPELDRFVKEGQWQKTIGEDLYGVDVHHSTLGIIGLGRIGEAICRRAQGFSMEICYHNRTRNKDAEVRYKAKYHALEELLQTADFIVLMTPLTPETKGLIAEKEFSLMKKEAIFINASRGQTIDEDALIKALKEKRIRAAALDVYQQEPVDPEHPLLKMPQVVTVPHLGSAVKKTRDAMAQLGAENLVKALYGEKPPNLVEELRD